LSPKALFVSIALKYGPAWDEKGPGVGRREKIKSAGVGININMAAPVLLNYLNGSQLIRITAAFLPSPRPIQLPSHL
jgi:hypothetical protein